MSHTPPVDSKGAAIDEILMEFGDEAVDSLFKDEKVTVEAFAKAKQAILAILSQEVKEIIGEDTVVNPHLAPCNPQEAQNRLRAEMRRKAGLVR